MPHFLTFFESYGLWVMGGGNSLKMGGCTQASKPLDRAFKIKMLSGMIPIFFLEIENMSEGL